MAPDENDATAGANDAPGATQNNHIIAIESELGTDALLLTSLDGIEAMSRSFVYTVEVLTRLPDERVRTLLGKPVTLWLQHDNETARRPLHGHARHLRRLELNSRGYRRWRMEVCPWLWFLTKSIDCRIYQHLSVPEILRSVFDDHELTHHQFRLLEQYPKLEFCVQYRESAFAFVSRLMEHVGIAYWFEHHADRHVLVIADSNQMAPFTQPRQATQSVRSELGQVQDLVQDFAIRTGAWALNDYDFEVPTKNLRTHEATILASHPLTRFEKYDYPGHFTTADDGKRLTRLRMEEEEAQHVQVSGLATTAAFDPGKRFELVSDRDGDKPAVYLLTEVRHRARDARYYSDAAAEPPTYSNHFVAIPADTPFRPERLTAKPIVQGSQTATVVGPASENIHTDAYGRVRVLFHWDRRGEANERASCWIRVSQQSAGSHWGGLSTPHVGQEVIVDFLEGDPDRPVVTGHLHNGTHLPPLNLPRDRNKTILRDHGDNKFIMHGEAGKQWMSMVAPRTLNLVSMRSAARPLSSGTSFEEDLDQDAFNELMALLTELKQAESTSPTGTNPTGSAFGTHVDPGSVITNTTGTINTQTLANPLAGMGDYTGDSSDINTLSQGKLNSLSLGNTNAWVGTDLNQEVVGETTTVAHGSVSNTYKSKVIDTFDTWHHEDCTLHTEIVGAHVEATAAHVEGTLVHIESTDVLHVEHVMGWHMALGDVTEINSHFQKIDSTDDKITAINTHLKTIDTEMATYATKVEVAASVQQLTSAIHSITATTFSLKAGVVNLSIGGLFSVTAAGVMIN